MTPSAQRLLNLIVRQIRNGRFVAGNSETYLGYKEIHDLLGLPRKGGTWGRSLQIQGLNDLVSWVHQKPVPAITGLIVDTTKNHRPGHGYFTAFNNDKEDYNWWRQEVRQAIGFDWSPYSSNEKLPTPKQLEDYESKFTEGRIDKLDTETRKRCEALVRRAKSFFRNPAGELRCAVCNWCRPSEDLKGDIVEIHHLRPLSSLPRQGIRWTLDEALKHLMPLCPNCHRVAHAKPGGGVFSVAELKNMAR